MGTRQEKHVIMEGVCGANIYKLLASFTRPISSTEHIVIWLLLAAKMAH